MPQQRLASLLLGELQIIPRLGSADAPPLSSWWAVAGCKHQLLHVNIHAATLSNQQQWLCGRVLMSGLANRPPPPPTPSIISSPSASSYYRMLNVCSHAEWKLSV